MIICCNNSSKDKYNDTIDFIENIISIAHTEIQDSLFIKFIKTYVLKFMIVIVLIASVITYRDHTHSQAIVQIVLLCICSFIGIYTKLMSNCNAYIRSNDVNNLLALKLHKWISNIPIEYIEQNKDILKLITREIAFNLDSMCTSILFKNISDLLQSIFIIAIIAYITSISLEGSAYMVQFLSYKDNISEKTNGEAIASTCTNNQTTAHTPLTPINLINLICDSIGNNIRPACIISSPFIVIIILSMILKNIIANKKFTYKPGNQVQKSSSQLSSMIDKFILYKVNKYFDMDQHPSLYNEITVQDGISSNHDDIKELTNAQFIFRCLSVISCVIFVYFNIDRLGIIINSCIKYSRKEDVSRNEKIIPIIMVILSIIFVIFVIYIILIQACTILDSLWHDVNIAKCSYEINYYLSYIKSIPQTTDLESTSYKINGCLSLRNVSINGLFSDLSFTVHKTTLTILMAPSGFGITTLLKHLSRQYGSDHVSGWIRWGLGDNKYISHSLMSKYSLLSQVFTSSPNTLQRNLTDNLNVSGTLVYPHILKSVKEDFCITKIYENYQFASSIHNASGGEKQRLGLSRTMTHLLSDTGNNSFIILDKNLSGIDHHTRDIIFKNLKKHIHQSKTIGKQITALVVSDDIKDLKYADNIVYIDDNGTVHEVDTIEQLAESVPEISEYV